MELVILRHGEAGKRLSATSKDAERTLTAAGRDQVREVAEALKSLDQGFDVVATSPLRRAVETAEIAAKVLGLKKAIEVWDELKPERDAGALFSRLSKMKRDASILIVGHEPHLSTVIGGLITGGREARIVLKKSGLAKLDVSTFSPRPIAELRWLLTPRLAKRLT